MQCEGHNSKCANAARYICTVYHAGTSAQMFARLYCAECTKRLVDGIAKVMLDNGSDQKVHEVLEVENLHEVSDVSCDVYSRA